MFKLMVFLFLSSLSKSHVSALLFSSQPLFFLLISIFTKAGWVFGIKMLIVFYYYMSNVVCCAMLLLYMLSSCHCNFLFIAASSENSFSSDSSHEYCVPPENISPPEPPAHRKDFEDVDGIYVEVRQEHTCMWGDYSLAMLQLPV